MGAGRPPLMDHQKRMHGHKFTRKDERELTDLLERRTDVPLKPKEFCGKKNEHLGKIWDDHVRRAPWLLEVDTSKLIMFCYQYAKFLKDPDRMKSAMFGHLRTLGAELGFDPLARTRMKRPNLPVRDYSDYPSHKGKGGKREVRSKKEEKRARREARQERRLEAERVSSFGKYT